MMSRSRSQGTEVTIVTGSVSDNFFHPFRFHFRLKNNKLKYNKEQTMLVLSALYLCPEHISRAMCH